MKRWSGQDLEDVGGSVHMAEPPTNQFISITWSTTSSAVQTPVVSAALAWDEHDERIFQNVKRRKADLKSPLL